MVGGHWVALGRWIEMILYALLHLVKVEGDGAAATFYNLVQVLELTHPVIVKEKR